MTPRVVVVTLELVTGLPLSVLRDAEWWTGYLADEICTAPGESIRQAHAQVAQPAPKRRVTRRR